MTWNLRPRLAAKIFKLVRPVVYEDVSGAPEVLAAGVNLTSMLKY
jgi:hypothetical protein